MPCDFRRLLDELGARVAAAWGEAARYDLEMRAGLLPELQDAIASAGDGWTSTRDEVLAGPRPRSVAGALLTALRQRARAVPRGRQVTTTAFIVTSRPSAELTPYHQHLLALLGPCLLPGEVQ